jgi:hypothetical protein
MNTLFTYTRRGGGTRLAFPAANLPFFHRQQRSTFTPRPARRLRRRNPGFAGVWRAKLAAGRGMKVLHCFFKWGLLPPSPRSGVIMNAILTLSQGSRRKNFAFPPPVIVHSLNFKIFFTKITQNILKTVAGYVMMICGLVILNCYP